MSENLITAGIIDPAQFPIDQVREQVATLLKISLNQIERLECWHHQIWVKLVESHAKFVSYRQLPLWVEKGLATIKRCTSRAMLDQLGEILRGETQRYDQDDEPDFVQQWRDAWAKQAQYLREEEEHLKPIRAHQQAGIEWQSAWQQVLHHCRDSRALSLLAPELTQQSHEFADLPEVMQAIQQLWQQRWQELSQAIA